MVQDTMIIWMRIGKNEIGTSIRCPRMALELYNETIIWETMFNNDTVYFEIIYLKRVRSFWSKNWLRISIKETMIWETMFKIDTT
jgi:hypothetical protein